MAGDTIGCVDDAVSPQICDTVQGTAGGSGKFCFCSFLLRILVLIILHTIHLFLALFETMRFIF
jgi:hypothetical protein